MSQAKKTATDSKSPPLASHLQRALKEGALYVFGFTAVYFLMALVSYHPADPGWSHSGGVHPRIANLGGPAGAWLADVFLTLFGY
ncbi:MAG: DNA translocase FtsK 4TM domain-containing protein, partial [Thiohalophilus sp.]